MIKILPALFAAAILFSGHAFARPVLYPFDVTVAGQKADTKAVTDLFATVAKSVAPDAEVVVDVDPERVIVNVFPTDAKGTLLAGGQAKAKVIIAAGPKFRLDQTMDKSALTEGWWAMNVVVASKGTARVLFRVGDGGVGDGDSGPTKAALPGVRAASAPEQSTPEAAVRAVFDAAKKGELGNLKQLVAADADGDVRDLATIAEATAASQAKFRVYFRDGRITAPAVIAGDTAKVAVSIGPGGERPETIELTRKAGRWFLSQF